ncbi:uncharacterized protein LOC127011673 [Drosophila biarmipes]|uniref:uncharacterized protein LOC127011673 n=1 Tax=Drosophila biarmipes TaxID=125945 RepID=UPI0021CCADF8|nr:uncharacterized protein LOC127011673 [Drosophila biarmipes]
MAINKSQKVGQRRSSPVKTSVSHGGSRQPDGIYFWEGSAGAGEANQLSVASKTQNPRVCDYQMEYSFVFEESSCEGNMSMAAYDNGFESLWQQVGEELRREREMNELGQLFQKNLSLSPPAFADQWRF